MEAGKQTHSVLVMAVPQVIQDSGVFLKSKYPGWQLHAVATGNEQERLSSLGQLCKLQEADAANLGEDPPSVTVFLNTTNMIWKCLFFFLPLLVLRVLMFNLTTLSSQNFNLFCFPP